MALFISSVFCIAGCTEPCDRLQSGDLLFVVAGEEAADMAIDAATSPESGESFSHVGMVEVCDEGIFVIDASSRFGVSRRPIEEFLGEAPHREDGSVAVRAMRLTVPFDADRAIAAAKSHIGEPYDSYYLPDNGRMYCSELVYECFRGSDGSPLFEARPMNFRAADGTFPEYWTELFRTLGKEIPQGVPGTNPNDMSRSALLRQLDWSAEPDTPRHE